MGRMGSGLVSLIFVHGFLGQPKDWHKISAELMPSGPHFFFDLNRDLPLDQMNFEAWPAAFRCWKDKYQVVGPTVLVGYSLGGRLALSLLENKVASRAVLLSAHWGLAAGDSAGREDRHRLNLDWARRFQTESWDSLWQSWNSQSVFDGSRNDLFREEKNFDRQKLAALITGFSLGRQEDFRFLLDDDRLRVLNLYGEHDDSYRKMAARLSGPQLRTRMIHEAGHRLLFDAPEKVAAEISAWI